MKKTALLIACAGLIVGIGLATPKPAEAGIHVSFGSGYYGGYNGGYGGYGCNSGYGYNRGYSSYGLGGGYYGGGLYSGGSYGGGLYGGGLYGGGYGYAPIYNRGHYDYHPTSIVPHYNHYDVIPGHYDYHYGSHGYHH